LERIAIEVPSFDLDYLRHLHRQLFCDVYDWAGELRHVDIAKGSTRFCNASRIPRRQTRSCKTWMAH